MRRGVMREFGKKEGAAEARPYLKFGAAAASDAPAGGTVGTLLCATRMRLAVTLSGNLS